MIIFTASGSIAKISFAPPTSAASARLRIVTIAHSMERKSRQSSKFAPLSKLANKPQHRIKVISIDGPYTEYSD